MIRDRWDSEDENENECPDNWDDSESEEEEISNKITDNNNKKIMEEYPIEWKKINRKNRKNRTLPKVIRDPYKSKLYIEQKPAKKKGKNDENIREPVIDKRFDKWQIEMANKLINKHHVILDWTTSCGKTWAVLNMVTELILRTDATAIFVTPNYEIMMEIIKEIITNYRKTYQHVNKTVAGFQTKKDGSQTTREITCQIICCTADNVTEFMSVKTNQEFINKLEFIILDEVHTESVNNALWRSVLIPTQTQFVLLSATIGNSEWLAKELIQYRPEYPVSVSKWNIRPIALQRGLFANTLKLSDEGVRIKYDANDIIYCVNLQDPTERDITNILEIKDICKTDEDSKDSKKDSNENEEIDEIKDVIGNKIGNKNGEMKEKKKNKMEKMKKKMVEKKNVDEKKLSQMEIRTEQYERGQNIVKNMKEKERIKFCDEMEMKINGSIELDDDINNQVKTILAVFQQIHSRGLGPGLFMDSDPSKLVLIAKGILALLQNMEREDKEVMKQYKNIDRAKKQAKRQRDDEDKIKHIKTAEDYAKLEIVDIPCEPDKMKFTIFKETIPRNTPGWIGELLYYGIGIYTTTMSNWLKEKMFEWFKDRKLAFVMCDDSLSLGINVPARSVILNGKINKTLFQQMGGRAGRRGYDTEGYVFILTAKGEKEKTRKILFDRDEVMNIKSMETFSMIDILRWSNKKIQKRYDSTALTTYIDKYIKIEKDENMRIYEERNRYLEETGWYESKYINLVMMMEDLSVMLFLDLVRNNLLKDVIPKEIDKRDNFCDQVKNFMIMLAYIWEPVEIDDSDEILGKMDSELENNIIKMMKIYGINTNMIENKKCSDYMLKFMKNGEYRHDMNNNIAKFQRKLFDVLTGFKLMAGITEDMDDKTAEAIIEKDSLLNLMYNIDKRIWGWCQQWSVKV